MAILPVNKSPLKAKKKIMHVAQTRTRKRNQQGGEVPAVSVIRVRLERDTTLLRLLTGAL